MAIVLCTVTPRRIFGGKKAPQYWSYMRKRNALRGIALLGGLPFWGTPSILTAIVKQFTNDTCNDTLPFPHIMSRRSSAMRFALLTAVVAIGALACGKKGDQTQNQPQAAPPAPPAAGGADGREQSEADRKSTRLNSSH